ncbi:hypothetical protein [Lysinibacillus fusiformis]|uniref:hypothetical protein n=1 Tax=Lysinibacillus fusiformis TaxID=28031 RepID=UPI0036EAE3F4
MPIEGAVFDQYSMEYYFTFPRIMNGIAVVGDGLHVGIGSAISLDVKDIANFNADAAVTKGEVLKILLHSLTYGYYGNGDGEKQSFNNIDKKHSLYGVVEQTVKMGIIQPANQFALDATLTRQEFAEWSIKLLQLDNVAKYKDIYKLNFADATSIDPAYTGYIALANGMGLTAK